MWMRKDNHQTLAPDKSDVGIFFDKTSKKLV